MAKRRRHSRLAAGLAVASALLPGQGQAGSFAVGSGETVVQPQVLDAPGDRGVIAYGGLLLVTGDTAITALVDGTAVSNAGRVVSDADGLDMLGAASLFNSGSIDAEGFAVTGSDLAVIVNAGTLSGGFAGIAVMDGNRIANGGSIMGEQGVSAGNGNSLSNDGTILGGFDGVGLGDGNTVFNTGLIEGRAFDALRADNGNDIVNTGMLRGSLTGLSVMDGNVIRNAGVVAAGGVALVAGSGNRIDNHGTLAGGEAAVEFTGSGNMLNLHAGSRLEGLLLLGGGNALNIGAGLNTALTFEGTPEIGTSGAPAVASGNMLAVVDPSVFSQEAALFGDLTRLLADAAGQRLSAPPAGSALWSSGFGGTGPGTEVDTRFGGGMLGVDGAAGQGLRAGGFLGTALTRADASSGSMAAETYFAGAYLGLTWPGYAAGLSLSGGVTHRTSHRTILNNLAEGGTEEAGGEELGVFLNPAASVSAILPTGPGHVIPSLRLRYAGLHLAGYEEEGSAASLTFDPRSLHLLEARAEIAYALPPLSMGEGALDAALRLGAGATASSGPPLEAELLGDRLTLAETDGDPLLRGFASLDLSYAKPSGLGMFLAAEAGFDSADGLSASASAGVELWF